MFVGNLFLFCLVLGCVRFFVFLMHCFHQAFDSKLRDVEVAESCTDSLCMPQWLLHWDYFPLFLFKAFISGPSMALSGSLLWQCNSMNCVVFNGGGFVGLSLLVVDFGLEGGSNMHCGMGSLTCFSVRCSVFSMHFKTLLEAQRACAKQRWNQRYCSHKKRMWHVMYIDSGFGSFIFIELLLWLGPSSESVHII